jgi:hypothetical protein
MSQAPDRVPVPTNGKGPPVETQPATDDAETEATALATAAFTPTQLAVGFGILASLVLLAARRMRRRNRSRSGGLFGRR